MRQVRRSSNSENVIGINQRSVFALAEARAVLPLIFRLTKQYSERVQQLIREIDGLAGNSQRIDPLEGEAGRLIQDWQAKIQKLGGLPKGLWIVDFDSGDGYFCWKFPERTIRHWHRYRDGFTKRRLVAETSRDLLNPEPVPN